MLYSSSLYIGIIIIIFIFCIFLLIFAPKSQNFFDKELYNPKLNDLANSHDLLLETSVRLNIVEDDDMNDNDTIDKIEQLRLNIPYKELDWKPWPDTDVAIGSVSILPLFILSKINKDNSDRFSNLLDIIKQIDDIHAIYFLKLGKNSSFRKHVGFSELSNNSLQFIYCFNAYCCDIEECGLWVNAESKKIIKDSSYIYDASKEFSLYNNTHDDIIYLIIDFKRPKNISNGYSEYKMTDEIIKAFESM